MKKLFLIHAIVLLLGFGSPAIANDWNQVVGVFSEDGKWRLDIGEAAMKKNIPASHNSWATRLVLKRLDGASSGSVEQSHVIGIFSEDGKWRLDIGEAATKKNIPSSHNSWATRLRIVPLNQADIGRISYGQVVGIFSEDGKWRLDIGEAAMKKNTPASHNSWATRLKIAPL